MITCESSPVAGIQAHKHKKFCSQMSEKCRSNKCDDVDDDADAVDDVHDDDVDDDEHLTFPLKNAIHYVFRLTTSYGWGRFLST